jgi:hypothetical protein
MNAIKTTAVLGLLMCAEIGRGGPLDTWTWRNPPTSLDEFPRIAAGGGTYVAFGGDDGSMCLVSGDGTNWSALTTQFGVTGVAYGNGQFVAVGDSGAIPGSSGVIATSTDGTNWIQRLSGAATSFQAVTSVNTEDEKES